MRTGSTHSLLALGFFAFVGTSCGPLAPWWDAVQKGNGTGTSGTGTGGTSGTASMCVRITEGGPGTCEDYATYKIRSADVCAQKNLVISSLEPGAMCGNGGVDSMTFVCCPPAPTPTPVTCSESTDATGRICKTCVDANGKVVSTDCNSNVPGSTGAGGSPGGGSGGTGGASGQMCTTNRLSSGTSCRSYDLWKQDASATCTQKNLLLTSITPGPACDGGIVGVTFTCCAPPTTSPPLKCTQTVDASGQVCKTCVDSVTGMVISNECAPGSDSGMCVTIDDGGASSCKDEATWKKYGTDRCAQQNLPLTDLKLAVACAGGYSMVTYVCCGSGAP